MITRVFDDLKLFLSEESNKAFDRKDCRLIWSGDAANINAQK